MAVAPKPDLTDETVTQWCPAAGRPIDWWIWRVFWFAIGNPNLPASHLPAIGIQTRPHYPWPGMGPGFAKHPSKPAEFYYPKASFGLYKLLCTSPTPGGFVNGILALLPYVKSANLLDKTD